MTVAELIETLQDVEDKSKSIETMQIVFEKPQWVKIVGIAEDSGTRISLIYEI
jgi:hypothetical protein